MVAIFVAAAGGAAADTYDAPANYYNAARPGGAWYTGPTLKSTLTGIIDGHVYRSYGEARYAIQLLDVDPNNANNVLLIYNGASVPKVWDSGVTWNREHQWPDSLISEPDDLFNFKPCNPSLNSSRGNMPYGTGTGEWDANKGINDRGDCARAMFYMATRYPALTLVYGLPAVNQMGDLADLLAWHYSDPVGSFERRRNHMMYSAADNPTYYQGNRNPFIDHPELVWAIWGTAPNDSMLYLDATPPADGASSATANLGVVIKDGPLPPAQALTLHKGGTHPTTYEVSATGEAASSAIGPRQAFVGSADSRVINAGLSSSTSTPGLKTGTLVIDNTELTSSGTGHGSVDGNDSIAVVLEVRDHANASFDGSVDQNTLTIDFGTVTADSGVATNGFVIYNLASPSGYTAKLDGDSISPGGDTAVLSTDLSLFNNLPTGAGLSFTASFDTAAGLGTYQSSFVLGVSDEDLPGAQPGTALVLTLTGVIANPAIFPFDSDGDSDVDLQDYIRFASCITGPDGGPVTGPCGNHDADVDGDVDLPDYAAFQAAFTGF